MPSRNSLNNSTQPRAGAAMATRSSWSGQLKIANYSVPVKAYPAAVTTATQPLQQLHAKCGERIAYQKVCPKHGPVLNEQIAKGFSYATDEYIELPAAELIKLQPHDDKIVHLDRFIKPEQLDLSWLSGRSHYLIPAHLPAALGFAAVCQALRNKNTLGLGHVVLSGRRQTIVVRPIEDRLMLHVLHPLAQLRMCPSTTGPSPRAVRKDVRALEKVIENNNGPICWEDYQDDFDKRLAALIRTILAARSNRRPARANGNGRSKSTSKRCAQANGTVKTKARRRPKAA